MERGRRLDIVYINKFSCMTIEKREVTEWIQQQVWNKMCRTFSRVNLLGLNSWRLKNE
jgi:hypothetical protein